jgi:hypothetical protein
LVCKYTIWQPWAKAAGAEAFPPEKSCYIFVLYLTSAKPNTHDSHNANFPSFQRKRAAACAETWSQSYDFYIYNCNAGVVLG